LLVVAVVLFFVQRGQTNRAFNLQAAQAMTAAQLHDTAGAIADDIGKGNWREYVKVWGEIQCDRPLASPLKQHACVAYTTPVPWEYDETETRRDAEGKTKTETHRRTKTVSSDRQSVPFQVDDGTGIIAVDPDGAELDTVDIVDDFQPGIPRGGMLSYGRFSLDVSSYSHRSQQQTVGYRYREAIIPLDRKILALGTVSDYGETLRIEKPMKSGQKYLISLKNDEALTATAKQGAQRAFYGMVGCGVGGCILVVLGLLTR